MDNIETYTDRKESSMVVSGGKENTEFERRKQKRRKEASSQSHLERRLLLLLPPPSPSRLMPADPSVKISKGKGVKKAPGQKRTRTGCEFSEKQEEEEEEGRKDEAHQLSPSLPFPSLSPSSFVILSRCIL